MRLTLCVVVLVSGIWNCRGLTESTSQVHSAFGSSSGDMLCSVTASSTSIELRGSTIPAGVVIGDVAIALAEKGSGKWEKGTEELGRYKIYQSSHEDYAITLKWTEGDSIAVLKRIEHFSITSKSDTGEQELYTYQSGHNDKVGTPPSCS